MSGLLIEAIGLVPFLLQAGCNWPAWEDALHVTRLATLTCYSKISCLWMPSQIVGLPYVLWLLVHTYKLVVVTDLSVPRKYGTYYSICDSICSPPPSSSTFLLWWLDMIPGWEGHVLETDAAHLRERWTRCDHFLCCLDINLLFTYSLLEIVLAASVLDILLNQ